MKSILRQGVPRRGLALDQSVFGSRLGTWECLQTSNVSRLSKSLDKKCLQTNHVSRLGTFKDLHHKTVIVSRLVSADETLCSEATLQLQV